MPINIGIVRDWPKALSIGHVVATWWPVKVSAIVQVVSLSLAQDEFRAPNRLWCRLGWSSDYLDGHAAVVGSLYRVCETDVWQTTSIESGTNLSTLATGMALPALLIQTS
jgi:hypothetical protein